MAVANTLAYYDMARIASVKYFKEQAPRANLIKHFTDVIYGFS